MLEGAFEDLETAIFALNESGYYCYANSKAKQIIPSLKIGKYSNISYNASGNNLRYFFMIEETKENLLCRRIKQIEDNKIKINIYEAILEKELEVVLPHLNYSKEKQEQLQNILDCIYDQIYVLDQNATILMVNKAVIQKNYRRESLIGRNMKDLIKEGYAHDSLCLKVVKSRKAEGMIFPEEEGYDLLSWGIPHFEDGEIDFVVCTEWDIENLIHLRSCLSGKKYESTTLQPELNYYRSKLAASDDIIAASPSMKKVLQMAGKVARSDATVLIQGESGTGKELLVRFIYNNSQRANAPFIEVNCGAIPENLVESELFGYEKGAFTSANRRGKPGLFEAAYQGTLFLDEIGELPFNAQATLLRALQEKTIYRVGGVVGLPIDVRIIAATNADLQKLVEDKLFREDLYYRLNVLPLYIPPLRERIEDIPLLIEHFTRMYNTKYKKSIRIEKQDYDLFMNYSWPGNVRELKNLIERVSIISNEETISRHLWIRHLSNNEKEFDTLAENTGISLKTAVEEYERNLLLSYMPKYKNSRQFAKLLGTNKTTINRKLQKYNIRKNND